MNGAVGCSIPFSGDNLSNYGSGTSGTVTSVSVVTANGVSGTVATPTTTPAITLTLAGIIPSLNTSAPNNTINASQILANGGTTNQDLVLQPKGTGAIILQLPDGTATGGDKRGANAIDLQTVRTGAGKVASGDYSVVVGGQDNSATTTRCIVVGGYNNTAFGNTSAVVGGQLNSNSGLCSIVTGGERNAITGNYSTVIGGLGLTLSGEYSFGFLKNYGSGTNDMTISATATGVFGNVNLWLANNDNTARELRFYEPQNTTGAFPAAGTNYTAFKAGVQAANVTYTLPTADGSSGNVLSTNGSGTLSWITAGSGTVTSVSVATANGFTGTATAGATPVITIQSTGTSTYGAFANATSGLDYSSGITMNTTTVTSLTVAGTTNINTTGASTVTIGNSGNTVAVNIISKSSPTITTYTTGTAAPVQNLGLYTKSTSGTPAVGYGSEINFFADTNGSTDRNLGYLAYRWSTATDASRVAYAEVRLANNTSVVQAMDIVPGGINIYGTTSGVVRVKVAAAAGTWNMTLPTSAGSSGQVLQTDGAGVTSWAAAGTGDMTLAGVQTVTGAKTFGTIGGAVGKLILAGSTSGSTILNAAAAAGSGTVVLPITGTLATLAGTEALTNKTVNGLTVTSSTGTLTVANSSTLATSGAFSITLTSTGTTNVTLPTSGTLMTNPMTTGGDIIYGGASGVPTRLANGTSGQVLTSAGGTSAPTWGAISITAFTSSLNTSSPNATVNASRLLASGGSTNQDAVIQPKGTGAFITQLPDSTSTGGDKRGTYAFDGQMSRSASTQVASGSYSVVFGRDCTAAATNAVAIGYANNINSAALYGVAVGRSNTINSSGGDGIALGYNNTINGWGYTLGSSNVITAGNYPIALGYGNTNTAGDYTAQIGISNTNTSGNYNTQIGRSNVIASNNTWALGYNNSTSNGSYNALIGSSNTITSSAVTYATALGLQSQPTMYGQIAQSSGLFSAVGDAQVSNLVARNSTTSASAAFLYLDGSSILPSIAVGMYAFEARVSAKNSINSNYFHSVIEGTIKCVSGTASIVGSNTLRVITNTAGTWTANVVVSGSTDFGVQVTGDTDTIYWVAAIKLVQIII